MKKMFFKKPLFFASLVLILIGLQGAKNVYAVIVDNDGCSGSRSSMIKFKYNNQVYIKRVYKDYCDSPVGSRILIKYDVKTNNLLYIEEDVEEQLGASYLLLVIGVIFAGIGWRKK